MINEITEYYYDEEILKADGFDDAVIGIEQNTMRLIYSVKKCIEILVLQGMSVEESIEYFDFNTKGSYVGEKTPIWCDDMFEI
jgi:hypothetical protein